MAYYIHRRLQQLCSQSGKSGIGIRPEGPPALYPNCGLVNSAYISPTMVPPSYCQGRWLKSAYSDCRPLPAHLAGSKWVTTRIWLHKSNHGSVARESQSRTARRLLALACRASGVKLNETHLALPGPELMGLISNNFGLSVSITHCPRLVAVALGKGQLGLDCEPAGKTRNWLGIADHFFTREEATTIANTSTAEQEHVFLRHWVLKESYIKSIKGSVFGDLNRLTLTEFGESANVEHRVSGQGRWAWVGSFAAHVLGVYCSDMSPLKLTFYDIENFADENSRLQSINVEGHFIPIN